MKVGEQSVATIIRQMRLAQGLSQTALAKRAGMLPAQLCKLESGRNDATGSTLRRLSEALNVKVSELLGERVGVERQTSVENAAVVNRVGGCVPVVLSSWSAETVEKIAKCAADFDREMRCVESKLGIAHGASLQLIYPYCADETGAALAARDMRNSLGLGIAPVHDLEANLELCGVRISRLTMTNDFQSMSFYDTSRHTFSIVLNSRNTRERDVYRLAYEIASVTAFAKAGFSTIRDEGETHRYLRRFSAAFLMPEESVRREVAQYGITPGKWTFDLLVMVKERYGVSAEAFALRLEDLGLIMPSVRTQLRERLHAYYAAHPKAMEPHGSSKQGRPAGRLAILKAAKGGRE